MPSTPEDSAPNGPSPNSVFARLTHNNRWVQNGDSDSLKRLLDKARAFGVYRRRAVRLDQLAKAGRPVRADRLYGGEAALQSLLLELEVQLVEFAAVLVPAFDDAVESGASSLMSFVAELARRVGFSASEVAWLVDEFRRLEYRPLQNLCAGDVSALNRLLQSCSCSAGDFSVQAGFVQCVETPSIYKPVAAAVLRARDRGVTASAFLVLTIVAMSHAVTAGRAPTQTTATRANI